MPISQNDRRCERASLAVLIAECPRVTSAHGELSHWRRGGDPPPPSPPPRCPLPSSDPRLLYPRVLFPLPAAAAAAAAATAAPLASYRRGARCRCRPRRCVAPRSTPPPLPRRSPIRPPSESPLPAPPPSASAVRRWRQGRVCHRQSVGRGGWRGGQVSGPRGRSEGGRAGEGRGGAQSEGYPAGGP